MKRTNQEENGIEELMFADDVVLADSIIVIRVDFRIWYQT